MMFVFVSSPWLVVLKLLSHCVNGGLPTVSLFHRVCVCVCVCEREREREE